MERSPRDSSDGVFSNHMGVDCVVQGVIVTLLVIASFFVGVYLDLGYIDIAQMAAGSADEEGVMMAFITLSVVEILHSFNMRSRRSSIFSIKRQNPWLWASAAISVLITVIVTVQPQLVSVFFDGAVLEPLGVALSLAIAALIIPIVEAYKAIMRKIEG